MKPLLALIGDFIRRTEGQDLLEYGLLVTLIAITALLAVGSVGDTIKTLWWKPIADAL